MKTTSAHVACTTGLDRGQPHLQHFWVGQTLSVPGDAFSLIAIPLLVLETPCLLLMVNAAPAISGLGGRILSVHPSTASTADRW